VFGYFFVLSRVRFLSHTLWDFPSIEEKEKK
jgi:hypothetical protein